MGGSRTIGGPFGVEVGDVDIFLRRNGSHPGKNGHGENVVAKSWQEGSYGLVGGDFSTIRIQTQLGGDEQITRVYWQDPWVNAVIRQIASMVASAKPVLYANDDDKADPLDDKDPLVRFLKRPHPELSWERFIKRLVTWDWLWGDLCLGLRTGDQTDWITKPPSNFAALVDAPTRDGRVQLFPFKPDVLQLRYKPMENGVVPSHWDFETSERGTIKVPVEAMVHIFDPDPYDSWQRRGLGRVTAILRAANQDWQADRFHEADLRTAGAPNTVITYKMKLSPEQKQELKQQYEENHAKPEKQGGALILDKEATAEFPGKTTAEMQWIEGRQWNRDTKIAALGLNKAMLGMTDDDTRANAAEGRRNAWEDTILPYQNRLAAEFKAEFFSKLGAPYEDYVLRFDTSNIAALKANETEKWANAKVFFDTFPGQTLRTTSAVLDIDLPEDIPQDDEKPEPEPMMAPPGGQQPGQARKSLDVMELPPFRTAAARMFQETVESVERTVKKKALSVFKGYLKEAKRRARDIAEGAGQPVAEKDFSAEQWDALLPGTDRWGLILAESVMPDLRKLWEQQSRLMADMLGAERLSATADPFAVEFLAGREVRLKETLVTLRAEVSRVVQNAVLEDGGFGTLADQVREVLEKYETQLEVMQGSLGARAERIARTETTSIANGARYQEAKEQGVQEMRWITARDALVREEHAELDGKVAAIGEAFGHGLKFPGDPDAGDAGLVVNCRCSITPTAKGIGTDKSLELDRFYRAVYTS